MKIIQENSFNPEPDNQKIYFSAVEESISKTGSFGIVNIQYANWFCDFSLCCLDFIQPIEPIWWLVNSKMSKQGAADKKHVTLEIPQRV